MPHSINYLLRNLLFGLGFFAVLYFGLYPLLLKNNHSNGANNFLILMIVNTVCYPFAKAVYDTAIGYLMGDRIYVTSIFYHHIYSVLGVLAFVFTGSILFAVLHSKRF